MSEPSDFFVVGGTLRAQSPSYVSRPADQELFERAMAGELCYVLTSRQMGKSSLMVRAARRLEANGLKTVIVDLTSIGTVSIDEWYLGLLSRVRTSLRLPVDVAAWWAEHGRLSPSQRFMEFLRDVVLAQVGASIVIFVDEIDTTLNLTFRDDFFAAIRAMYNERASTPAYQRLTFVLLGVATPTDLIQDRDRTPFNIGRQIVLQEFSYDDAAPLREGLDARHAEQGDTILRAIFAWTNGHPYLTQKLCQLASARAAERWDAPAVEALVREYFLAEDAPDDNLKFVQNRVQSSPPDERRRMLRLYRRIHAGEAVPDDDRSKEQNYLQLYGLVRPEGQRLRVRNEIYRRVFDQRWIKAAMPPIASRRLAAVLSLAAVLIAVLAIWAIPFLNPGQPQIQVQTYVAQFNSGTNPNVRMAALASLFRLQQSWSSQATATAQPGGNGGDASQNDLAGQAARSLFLNLGSGEQRNLFLQATEPSAADILVVVRGLVPALNTAAHAEDDPDVMEAMGAALTRVRGGDAALATGLTSWSAGRREAARGHYQDAITSYKTALQAAGLPGAAAQEANPALHYDWALALTNLKLYTQALDQLNTVVKQVDADPVGSPDDTDLPRVIDVKTSPDRFVSANRAKKVVQDQLTNNAELLAALQDAPDKFPELKQAYGPLLANLAQTQTARAQLAAGQTATAAQATVTAVGVTTATVLGQTSIAQAATVTSIAQATGTSLASTAAATLTPTRTPRPTPTFVTLSPTTSVDVTATAQAIQAATDAASQTAAAIAQQPAGLAFATSPRNIVAGASLGEIDVEIQNASGARLTNDNSSVTLSIEPGSGAPDGALLGKTSVIAANGRAAFTGLTIRRAGAGYRLRASVNGLPIATSNPFDVIAGSAVKLVFVDHPGQPNVTKFDLQDPVLIEAHDRFDNVDTSFNQQVVVSFDDNTSVFFPNGSTSVGPVARYTPQMTAGKLTNSICSLNCSIALSTPGLPDVSRTYHAPFGATRLAFGIPANEALVGTPLYIVICAVEDNSVIADSVAGDVTLSIQSRPAGGTFGPASQLSGSLSNGCTSFNNLSLSQPGTYMLKATSGSLSGTSAALTIFSAATATPTPSPTATPTSAPTQVIVYSGANFTGNSQLLGSGAYGATVAEVPLGNDTIKSVRIPQGWSVVLYRDFFFQLPSPILTQDIADASGITAGVSGICVRAPGENVQTCPNMQPTPTNTPTPTAVPAQVVVYSGANFTGSSQLLGSGAYGATVAEVPLGNDTIKSVRIPQGWSVVLYRDFFFQLPSPILTQDIADASGITAGVSGICVRAPGENPQTCPNMSPPTATP